MVNIAPLNKWYGITEGALFSPRLARHPISASNTSYLSADQCQLFITKNQGRDTKADLIPEHDPVCTSLQASDDERPHNMGWLHKRNSCLIGNYNSKRSGPNASRTAQHRQWGRRRGCPHSSPLRQIESRYQNCRIRNCERITPKGGKVGK